MKKLLLILTALLATVGTRAQDYDGVYTLGVDVNKQRGYVCAGEGYAVYPVLTEITYTNCERNSVTPVANGKNWYLRKASNETGYYIYNVALNKFLIGESDNVNFGDTPQVWQIADYNGYKVIIHVALNKLLSGACATPPANRIVRFNTNNDKQKGDGGSKYTIEEVPDGKTTFAEQIAAADAKIDVAETPIDITVKVKEAGTETERVITKTVVAGNINVKELLSTGALLTYNPATISVTKDGIHEFSVTYTKNIPFAASFDELEGKWVSFFTYHGRMFVFDDNSVYVSGTNEIKQYPCIDKVTFTNLTDRKFWGFICEDPFTSATVKIVNKGAGKEKGTLYLTKNTVNSPLLLATEQGGYITNEWVVETGKNTGGEQYYGIKANGTGQYIQNRASIGFMVTHNGSANADDGSNIKFTSEYQTYQTLKERALNAPFHAAHSLNEDARQAIKNADAELGDGASEAACLAKYKEVIADINNDQTDAGFIGFSETKYYYLRNYTPAGENTYVLASTDGANAKGVQVPNGQIGSADEAMAYSDINAIWKITTSENGAPVYKPGSEDIGVSKTIGRDVTHVNSGKKMTNTANNNNVQLNATGCAHYFVNLGAGQHFLKLVQYNGTGQQAMAGPLVCANNGNITRQGAQQRHLKNSRATWYGIEVSNIKVTIGAAGWATLHLPFGVDLPENSGLKAYMVSDIATADGASTATLTEVTSIPANQGVILKGAADTYSLRINDAAAWTGVTNKLRGSNLHENVTDEAYVLSLHDGKAGLYKAQMSGSSWLNNDNKAYLPASEVPAAAAGAQSLSFVFDGTETSIEGVEAAKAGKSAVYDLSGRRVKSAVKGIYIINGKKVVK